MELIDAHWDTRNLGVRTAEITFLSSDAAELPNLSDFEYIVAKVPTGRPDIVSMLECAGFRFAETQIVASVDLSLPEPEGVIARMASKCSSVLLSQNDAERVYEKVLEGIFRTDRVALDPQFGIEVANRRYVGWMKDDLERGSELHEFYFKDIPSGFFTMRYADEGEACPSLGGLYREAMIPGLGICLSLAQVRLCKQVGCKRIKVAYSSNNLPVVKNWETLGAVTKSMSYVLVLHRS